MSIIGLLIGLYAYLFPGNINIMVLDLYGSKKYRQLLWILALIVLFESLYCVLTLRFLAKLKTSTHLYMGIELVSYIIVMLMGLWMCLENRRIKSPSSKSTLYRGVFSIVLHPQQIPFWFIVGVVLNPFPSPGMNTFAASSFVFFNAIGTLLAMCVYMVFGNKLLHYFNLKLSQVNRTMGIVYVLLSGYSLVVFGLR
jgi:hypothetical protein